MLNKTGGWSGRLPAISATCAPCIDDKTIEDKRPYESPCSSHTRLCRRPQYPAPRAGRSADKRSGRCRQICPERGGAGARLRARQSPEPTGCAGRFHTGWLERFYEAHEGYVDAKGVPEFSQSFVPSGDAKVIDEESGMVHLTILGRLKQTHDSSSTTYGHVEIDVRVGGTPIKIQHLEPTIVVRRSE